MAMKPDQIFMVLDVESVGLQGEGYSVGWVVIKANGEQGTFDGHNWAMTNALPIADRHGSPWSVRQAFLASNIFQCLTCEGKPEFDGVSPLKEHLEKVHALTEFNGKKKLIMHLACVDSYHLDYEWEIGPVKLAQFAPTRGRKATC